MTDTLTTDELLRLRVGALGLSGDGDASAAAGSATGAATDSGTGMRSGAERIAAVARRMLALQGQDWRAARWALGVRAPGTTAADVHEAFNSGAMVRSWPMRGTLHVLAAEDIGWMQAVTNDRVLARAPKRRAFLGMSDAALEKLVDVSVEALRDGASYNRDELAAVWSDAGIEWQSNWRYHIIWWLCQNGLAVFGPVSGDGEPRLVSAQGWISQPRRLSGDEALAELAARYASARGAVTARDLAWWSGLTARDAKLGLAAATATGRLVQVESAVAERSIALWADPLQLEQLESAHRSAPEWLLLPAFDEHLLGYQDRAPQLAPEHFERIVPGRNGMFLANVVHEGAVVGTWKRGTRKGEGLVGTPLPERRIDASAPGLQLRAAAWAAFHDLGETPFDLAVAP